MPVGPDLVWASLPLPYRINHINAWLVRDGAGWAVVDTGTHTEAAMAAWDALLAGPCIDGPLTRVIATHMHPDHVGLAGWLQQRHGAALWMSEREYLTCRVLMSEKGQVMPEADPLDGWLRSIDRIEARVPDDVLVLPAHHAAFHGLHARLAQLRDDQLGALDRLRDGLVEPRRVVDVFPLLFRKPIRPSDASQLGLATGEAIACLNHLMHLGEVRKALADDGVAWYRQC